MDIALLDIKKPGDNKDYNGGFGTTFNVGKSILSKVLSSFRSHSENFPTMSYAYIAAIFKKYGHSVKLYNNKLPEFFDILLLHVSLIRHDEEIRAIKKLKELGKENIGVFGPLATVKPELFKDADFIIVGEPEEAIFNICKKKRIPKGRVKSQPIMDLDTIPFADWSIYDLSRFSFSPILPMKPFTFVLASRGCPYNCSYCPYLVFGTYRVRKPEKVVEELINLKNRYKVKSVYFRDPTFSINQKRIEKIAELMIHYKLNIKWGCETRLDLLTIPLLNSLYKSGLRAIKVGIESPDHDLLKKMGRLPSGIAHQEKIIDFCKKRGIKIIAFYIIGLPGETVKSVKNTISYSRKLNTSFANFTICTPIPGTKFYEKMNSRIFDRKLNHYDNFHVVLRHDNISKKELLKFQEKAIIGYYFRVRYILRYLIDKIKIR